MMRQSPRNDLGTTHNRHANLQMVQPGARSVDKRISIARQIAVAALLGSLYKMVR
jgi:hypothetical protein